MLRTLLLVFILVLSGSQCQEAVYDDNNIDEYPGLGGDYPDYPDYPNYEYDPNYEDYPHHQDYPPVDLSNVTLKKCQCQGNEVLVDGECQEKTTFVAVLLIHGWTQVPANTSDFGHVQVGKLQCPPNHIEVKRNTHQFSVLDEGHLIDTALEFIYVDYCIEHLLDEKGELTWEAYGCITPPKIHTCCSETEILNSTYDCVPSDSVNSPPPLYIEDQPKQFTTLEASNVSMLNCDAEEGKLTKVILDGTRAILRYHPTTPTLLWSQKTPSLEESKNYCVAKEDSNGDGILQDVAFLCYTNPLEQHRQKCENSTCVRKCCPEGALFDMSIGACTPIVNETEIWVPEYHTIMMNEPKPGASAPKDLAIIEGLPVCSTDMYPLEPHKNKDDKFHLLKNGSMHVPLYKTSFDSLHYCMDNFRIDDSNIETLALLCFDENAPDSTKCPIIHNILHPTFLLISAIFLAIVMIVYISIPELHAKVHGKCLVSHCASLLIAFVFLVIVKWANEDLPTVACKTMASVIHISFLSAFFWLNVMCFDIWWTLKSMRPVAESGDASRRRFRIYSLYAWGCPFLIGIIAIVMNELPEEYEVIRPGFGVVNCWFAGTTELWTYFYGFILLLVIFNIIYFCHVSYILITMQRRNDPILNRTKKQERERVWLYLKLFSVMGITWVAEIISWAHGSCWAWFFTDAINALQGLFIFLIFICKANMLKKIRDQWSPYIRTFKKAVGSTRITRSTAFTTTKRSDISVSQTEQANNDSKASQRTTESVLESSSGKTLTQQLSLKGSVPGPVTGAQIHIPLSVKELPISEASSQDMEADTVSDKHKTDV